MSSLAEKIMRDVLGRATTAEDYRQLNEMMSALPAEIATSPGAMFELVSRMNFLQQLEVSIAKAGQGGGGGGDKHRHVQANHKFKRKKGGKSKGWPTTTAPLQRRFGSCSVASLCRLSRVARPCRGGRCPPRTLLRDPRISP